LPLESEKWEYLQQYQPESVHVMKKKQVFLVPLNWGLGHAARSIPVIRKFIDQGDSVLVGGSPSQLILLTDEFPGIKTVKFPYSRVSLKGKRYLLYSFLCQSPIFLLQIFREHIALKKVIKNYKIDLVVSDNCYGLWNKNIHSIFITHQLNIKLPDHLKFLSKSINNINHWFIKKYDECWIPDLENSGGYAGELSHSTTMRNKIRYIGILSRFSRFKTFEEAGSLTQQKSILILISGPENQRSVFEKIIKDQISAISDKYEYTIIRGLPEEKSDLDPGWNNHMPSKELMNTIGKADAIICRSGYSTIMDLLTLNKTALLVPTPGQAEQEYLAEYLSSKKLFCTMSQNEFDIVLAIEKLLSAKR